MAVTGRNTSKRIPLSIFPNYEVLPALARPRPPFGRVRFPWQSAHASQIVSRRYLRPYFSRFDCSLGGRCSLALAPKPKPRSGTGMKRPWKTPKARDASSLGTCACPDVA
jgi:hypothetical protein